jgi:nitrogen regulatory protein P-II 1
MKKVEAIIRKSKWSEVKAALHDVGINFITYWDVTGVGNERQGHIYRGISYRTSDIQRRSISFVCSEELLESSIEAVLKAAYTGEVGDGKIFVSEILGAYRIRTKEKDEQSLK